MKYLRHGWIFALATFLLVWWAARIPIWSSHLQVDVWISWLRVSYFFENAKSFGGMTGNEILPATLYYILLPVWLIPVGWLSYQTYLPATLALNMIPLLLTWRIVENKKMFLSFLLVLGPILLFRFDGMVTLLLVASFLAFTRKSLALSGSLLGIATGMKVFPILFLPYLVLILWRDRDYWAIARMTSMFVLLLIIPVGAFMMMGGSYEQVVSALSFHSQKLISIESIPGSLITGWSLLTTDAPPPLLPGNGIWSVPGPHVLFNKIWMIPVAGLYLFISTSKFFLRRFRWEVPLVLMLVFLVFSKNLNPQYIWWFMVFLPFVKASRMAWVLTLFVAVTNQLVYPVFYTTFIESFYRHNQAYWIYLVLLGRNIAIVGIMFVSFYRLITLQNTEIKYVKK